MVLGDNRAAGRRAVAIRFTTPGAGVALAVQQDCSAAVMETADGGASWERQKCLGGAGPGCGANEDFIAAQVGDRFYLGSDGGQTWSRPEG